MTAREHVLRRRLVFATHEAQSAKEAPRRHCEARHGDIERAPGTGPKMSEKMGVAGCNWGPAQGLKELGSASAPWECL